MLPRWIAARTPGHGAACSASYSAIRSGLPRMTWPKRRTPMSGLRFRLDPGAGVRAAVPLGPVREAVPRQRLGPRLRAVAGPHRKPVRARGDHDRIQEMLVEMVDVLDHPALEAATDRDVVDRGEMLHELAQTDAAGMGTHGNAELRREEEDRDDLVHAARPAGV